MFTAPATSKQKERDRQRVEMQYARPRTMISPAILPIMERAGTAFHSSQNVMKEEVTRIIPGINTVVK